MKNKDLKKNNLNKFDYYFFNVLSYGACFLWIICWLAAIWVWKFRGELFVSGIFCIIINSFAETNIKAYKLKVKSEEK